MKEKCKIFSGKITKKMVKELNRIGIPCGFSHKSWKFPQGNVVLDLNSLKGCGSDFFWCVMRDSCFNDSDLRNSHFKGVDFRGCDFTGAKISKSQKNKIRWLK